mgnify:CR=1 FL=1
MKCVFFDITYLEYGGDLRGVPQVIDQLIRLVLKDRRLSTIRFIVTQPLCRLARERYNIADSKLTVVPRIPLLGQFDRFHGLLVDVRYWRIRKRAALILHPEYRTVLWSSSIRQFVLFHDLIFLDPPSMGGEHKFGRRAYFKYKAWKASYANAIVTHSRYTKIRLLREFPHLANKDVTPLHLGVRASLTPRHTHKDPPGESCSFLYVGSVEPRKNIPALLRAFPLLRSSFCGHLNLVGKLLPAQARTLDGLVSEIGLRDCVTMHGLVSGEELRCLYEKCHFLLFPSLQEGFGLPIVEAMHYGLIVFAFENSSIPEIGGTSAIIRQNNSFRAWADELHRIAASPGLYEDLSRRSQERAVAFTEEAMFRRYGDYISSLLETG